MKYGKEVSYTRFYTIQKSTFYGILDEAENKPFELNITVRTGNLILTVRCIMFGSV